MDSFLGLLVLYSLLTLSDSLSWSIKQPNEIHKGSPATLEWAVSLTTEEKSRADRFSLVLLEREKFLYSNRWQVMVVKQFSGGVHQEIGNQDTFDVLPGNDLTIRLNNVTDTDATRFRCTFFSSFAAPKSIIQVEIKDLPIEARLVGGSTPNKGRVELYRNGYWGTICNDGWDVPDATVVCRMLGYSGAWTAGCCSEYRGGTGPIWLSELSCTGREKTLSECGHSGWGVNNCDHTKDAKVTCQSSTTEKPSKYSSLGSRTMKTQFLRSATPIIESSLHKTVISPSSIVQSSSSSTVSESSKASSASSSFTKVEQSVITPTPSSVLTSTSIYPTMPPVIHVELLDDRFGYPNQGRLSVYYNGQWGTVCDDSWDITDAHVVCRMLGYPGAVAYTTNSQFGGAKDGPIWLDEVHCTGNESSLAACQHDGWGKSDCDHSEDAGVICDFNYTVTAQEASCNFDIWYCGWENGPGNPAAFKWTRQFGPTPSHDTGPSRDHTSGRGYYFYIEASGRFKGDVARLESPKIQSNGIATCMIFYYHLYGRSVDTLRVKAGDQVLWQISGEQGNSWYKATVPLNFDGIYRVTFEGVVGQDAFSDIAIDDIEFKENTTCAKTAESSVSSRIVWISPSKNAELGSNVTLGCTATGRPPPRVVWKKDGRVLLERHGTANINIFSISQAGSGSYECSAINIVGNDTRITAINVEASPRETNITTNVSYNVAALGEHVAIQCSSNGSPQPICQIYHKGNLINVSGSMYVIQNFTAADQGEYTCNCSNVAGVDQINVTLALYESPRIHTILPKYQLVNETATFEIFCNATGNPPPTIAWTKVGNNSKVYPTGRTLRVENADKSNFGTYKCKATSVRGGKATADASIELDNFSPNLDYFPGNITVLERDRKNVTFYCNATGRPKARLSWVNVREGTSMASGNTLLFQTADRSDRGEYRCVAYNGVGNPASKSVYLDVQYAPSSTRLSTDKVNALVRGNDRIVLTCVTDANPPASQYRFYHEGVYLRTSFTGKHVIQKARHSNVGIYKCVPINSLGTGTNSSLVVSVFGAFSIINFPQNVTVNQTVSASFFCNATSYPPHQALATHISWSKLGGNGKVFPTGQHLILQNVSRHEAGTYICKAENGLGLPDTAMAVLSVLHKPYDTKLQASVPDNVGVINSSLIVNCTANANPAVTAYNIYHNGILVSNSSSGIHNITRALAEHNGSYVCIPYNAFGAGESAALNVSFVGPCGVKRVYVSWSPLIVGGVAAKPGEWPWQAQLGYFDDNGRYPHICGGSILDHYWIATAAHCVMDRTKLRDAANLNVTVGELHRGVVEGSEQSIPVETIVVHEEFDLNTLQNDIALMKLKRPILFNAHVSPICVPKDDFTIGTTCYVTGWGLLGPLGSASDILQETAIPLLDHGMCKHYYKLLGVTDVTSDMRCAGALGQSQGTCKADSGGPLACERDGRWHLVGITSWTNGGCMDQGDPGVFSDTFHFRNWIEDVMRNNTRSRA